MTQEVTYVYSPLAQLAVQMLQIIVAVFGSFGALRALDQLSGISFGRDIVTILKQDPKAMAAYASVRFATVCGAMAYLCSRFV